jgi:hypothetical protein
MRRQSGSLGESRGITYWHDEVIFDAPHGAQIFTQPDGGDFCPNFSASEGSYLWHDGCLNLSITVAKCHNEADMRQFETFTEQSLNPTLRLSGFIAELRGSVQSIDAVIQVEEERSNAFHLSSATHSSLARQLRLRRQNLIATISLLEGKRVPPAA